MLNNNKIRNKMLLVEAYILNIEGNVGEYFKTT